MSQKRFRDYGIRPKGSPEISYDPFILSQMATSDNENNTLSAKARKERVANVYNFMLKTALDILPPKQREIFYSVWARSGGQLSKGVMKFSRKISKSHFTSYNNYYKAVASLRIHLDRTGYSEHIIMYLKGEEATLPGE